MPAAAASRYARALVDVVLGPSSTTTPDRVRQDLQSFEQTLAGSTELASALESPSISRARKRAIISRLTQSLGISGVSKNFLLVLADHRRTAELAGVIAAFDKLVDERLGSLQVDVASAGELQPRQQEALTQRLAAMTGKKIRLHLKIDRDLVGGMVVRVGSTVFDGSVRGQLDALGRRLQAE
jgi:F-type H+-transporting ATPase subunit delta